MAGHGQQDLVLGGEPVHSLLTVCGLLGPRPRGRRGEREAAGQAECHSGGVGSVQVVVEESADGGALLAIVVGRGGGLLGRVGAQQVMQRIPARVVLGSRLAQVSSSSSPRAAGRPTPARLAAAATLTSGPGCRPSSRNIRAGGWLRAW